MNLVKGEREGRSQSVSGEDSTLLPAPGSEAKVIQKNKV